MRFAALVSVLLVLTVGLPQDVEAGRNSPRIDMLRARLDNDRVLVSWHLSWPEYNWFSQKSVGLPPKILDRLESGNEVKFRYTIEVNRPAGLAAKSLGVTTIKIYAKYDPTTGRYSVRRVIKYKGKPSDTFQDERETAALDKLGWWMTAFEDIPVYYEGRPKGVSVYTSLNGNPFRVREAYRLLPPEPEPSLP